MNIIMSEEANQEVAEYLNSYKAILSPEKKFLSGGATDTIGLMWLNFTGNVPN